MRTDSKITLLFISLASVGAGCPTPDTGSPGDPVDTGEPVECDTGYLADRGECVPEACGTGDWGDLETSDGTVFVNAAAPEGGDGSMQAPFTTIQEGLDAVAADGTYQLVMAAGTYQETLTLDGDHAGLALEGRCAELVTLDGSGGAEDQPALRLDQSRYTSSSISGLAVTGGQHGGIYATEGKLELRDVRASDNLLAGIVAAGSGTEVVLANGIVEGSTRDSDFGFGILVTAGATLRASSCTLADNATAGLYVEDGATVELDNVTVSDTQAGYKDYGKGAWIIEGSTVTIRDSIFEGNVFCGVAAYGEGTTVVLEDTWVQDTAPTSSGEYGQGIVASAGANLVMVGGGSLSNHGAGIHAQDEGTTVSIDGVEVAWTAPSSGDVSGGLIVILGAILTATDCEIHDNDLFGAYAATYKDTVVSTLTMTDCRITDTQPGTDTEPPTAFGIGLHGGSSASLSNVTISATTDAPMSPAVFVHGGSTLRATGGEFASSSGISVIAFDTGSQAILDQVVIRDTRCYEGQWSSAIVAAMGGQVEVDSCSLEDNVGVGFNAMGEGSTISILDSTITNLIQGGEEIVAVGVSADSAGSVSAEGLTLEDVEGIGLYSWGAGSSVVCEGCAVSGALFAGAAVRDGGMLTLTNSTIQDVQPSENLGGGVGIYASSTEDSTATLKVDDSSVEGCLLGGVWLNGSGSYNLAGSSLAGGEGEPYGSVNRGGDAIFATGGVADWQDDAGLLLAGNTLQGGLVAGLMLDDATATLEGNSYLDNPTDIVVQGDACELGPEGWETETSSIEQCPEYDYPTCALELTLEIEVDLPDS